MSHYSQTEYSPSSPASKDAWFQELYFQRWFANNPGPILDIGCATGNFIAVRPDIIEGIDIDKDSLDIATKRGFRVKKLNAETELAQLADNQYAGIYAKHVVEHLEHPLQFLQHIKRILKPGGRAVISTPNCPYTLTRMFYDDYTHVRPLTIKSLRMIAYDAGFTQFSITEDFRCFPGLGRLIRLSHVHPDAIGNIQHFFHIRGLSLILIVEKDRK